MTIEFTKKRFQCLSDLSNGKDYAGSAGIRRLLEKSGFIRYVGPPPHFYGKDRHIDNFSHINQSWVLTNSGVDILKKWSAL